MIGNFKSPAASPRGDNYHKVLHYLISLVGFENLELCGQLIEKRELIQEQCRSIEENLKKEKSASNYKPKNFDVSRPGVGVSVEHVQVRGKGKHRKVVQQVS